MSRMLLFLATEILFCGGCKDPTPASPGQRTTEGGTVRWTGLEADQGFGSAVAISSSGVWASAPHGQTGTVFCLDSDGTQPVIQGDGRMGSQLIPWRDGFIASAPLAHDGAGQLIDQDGSIVAEGPASLGTALWTDGSRWVASHGSGWVDSKGASESTAERPTSIAISASIVGVGSALGDSILLLPDVEVARTEPLDFAGYSLSVADIDADGVDEWLVGAPGMNRVEIRSPDGTLEATLQGEGGRFGASLSTGDVTGDGWPDLIVGAPASGENTEGAAHLYQGGSLERIESWSGESPGDQLGFSLALSEGVIAIGLPGAADSFGRVWRVELEQ